ncbi:MAG: hypothetical protein Q9184_006549 [Pyrenodesmia sp. 2 TL-2023]
MAQADSKRYELWECALLKIAYIASRSAYSSPFFEILAGPSAVSLNVHAGVLSKSKVLKKEVDGLWKESAERKIDWQHWTVSAVEKFIDWLYTGDYVCPYPIEARTEEEASAASGGDDRDDDDRAVPPDIWDPEVMEPHDPAILAIDKPVEWPAEAELSTQDIEVPEKTKPAPLPLLQDLDWQGCRTLGKLSQAEEFDKWTGHWHWKPQELDYEATFLTHAELYVMANQYMLDELKSMAWQRLRAVLISVGKPKPWSPVVDNTVTLIKYAYEHTGGIDDGEEPLRMLLSSFVALHFTSFKGYEVNDLILSREEANREFVLELMGKVTQQMAHLETNEKSKSEDIYYSFGKVDSRKAGGKKKAYRTHSDI